MILEEIKRRFKVESKGKNEYLLFSKSPDPTSRNVHRYFCTIRRTTRRGGRPSRYYIVGGEPIESIRNIDVLANRVKTYVSSLPYDSDYYYPHYRQGIMEEFFVLDYMAELGFEHLGSDFLFEFHKGEKGDNGAATIRINFSQLSALHKLHTEVGVNLWHNPFSWTQIKCQRNCEELKRIIQKLVKPQVEKLINPLQELLEKL